MKINRLITSIVLFGFLFSACEKEVEEVDPCETYKWGYITIYNISSDPYKIYIDNVFITLVAGGTVSDPLTITEGNNRKIFAEQASGYLIWPTTRETTVNILRCSDYTWEIP